MEKESCTIFHGWNLKKTKVATKNKAVFNKPIWANEIKYIGINSTVSNIYGVSILSAEDSAVL